MCILGLHALLLILLHLFLELLLRSDGLEGLLVALNLISDLRELLLERFGCLLKLLHLVGILLRGLAYGFQLRLEDVVLDVLLVQDHLVVLLNFFGDALKLLRPLPVDLIFLTLLLS